MFIALGKHPWLSPFDSPVYEGWPFGAGIQGRGMLPRLPAISILEI